MVFIDALRQNQSPKIVKIASRITHTLLREFDPPAPCVCVCEFDPPAPCVCVCEFDPPAPCLCLFCAYWHELMNE